VADEPLTHIARPPLPWRESDKTICGHPVSQYVDGLVINVADAHAAVRRLGKQRFALTHCMTCAHNVGNWSTWEDDPRARMARELDHLGMTKAEPVIEHELRAIALLIEAHRGEFDDLVQSYASGDVVSMDSLRRSRAERVRRG